MNDLSNFIPVSLPEVAVKLAWEQAHGQKASEDTVILAAVLENVRAMLEEALEGPYWEAAWEKSDQSIIVTDAIGHPVGTIKPQGSSFIADFRADAPKLIGWLDQEVQQIVKQN
ncbi:MAG: hypothetical protein ABF624_07020 [Liquorilactobacillus ghanensis]|jgi:hypothetical protein|uniref:Uncharacterized protein n=1 Tax=Liquorilactobacillus ghanensis DSM 18630 TaxID=1423750 RepID=A0A0R1VQY3_9LACO|nr:hypothetical protein [Liquorilactobacillus ghanensis]KRM04060.1 hypothetical protein FC89_GL002463 [Liquorilactobacillus ghanensis DSM 18630]